MQVFDLQKIWSVLTSSPLRYNDFCQQYETQSPLLFHSGLFVFLFLGFVAIYYGLHRHKTARLLWGTVFSLYFYYKCAGIFWLLHVLIVVVDFYLARWMYTANKGSKGWLLSVSLLVNLGMLVYFKYSWDSELWCEVLGKSFDPCRMFLPAGISFFTFQSLSYTIDVYRGQLKPLDSMLDYAFFVTFFPQMVAGPIVRAADFLPQINPVPYVSRTDFGRAVFLISIGLFKKAVISDYISANFVDRVFAEPTLYSGVENLLAVYGYALQIYCDFSGYSDMAIGIALLLGFKFPINFDSPYQSRSVTEFWRRWHISLSSWLRDYLYIPLGGNRYGSARTYVNLLLTMLLGGLWHGAALRFVLWGGLHGAALAVERLLKAYWPTRYPWWRQFLGVLWTFHVVCFCWIFFRAAGMGKALEMLQQIAYNFQPQLLVEVVSGYAPVFAMMLLGYLLHFAPRSWELAVQQGVTVLPLPLKAALLVLMALLIMQMQSTAVQPFIYFQF